MAKDLAIILNSGSINSLVTTALAAQKYRPILLHVEIAPAQGSRLRAAYDQQVAHFRPYREHTLTMPFLSILGAPGSSTPRDPRAPARLGTQFMDLLPLIAAGLRFAAHYQAASMYFGLRVGIGGDELAQATEFIQIWNELTQIPCALPDLEVITPLLEPWQVVDVGVNIGAPMERAWSCVEESSEPCWACAGCRAREQAFQQAGKPDPLRQPARKA